MVCRASPILLILFLFSSILILLDFRAFANPDVIDVPLDFPTIQAAINNANDGDVIFVDEGLYNENIVVNKTVSLVGKNRERTIVHGSSSGIVARIAAENTSVANFTIRSGGSNNYESGIFVDASFSNITDNIVVENGLFGICLNHSFNSFISRNVIKQNKADGLVLFSSSNNTLLRNTITENNAGLQMYSSYQNIILNNTLTENNYSGMNLFYSSNNWLLDNNLTGNIGQGIILDFSSENNTLTENTITATIGYGLTIGSCSNNTLRNNTLSKNLYNFYCLTSRPNLSDFLNDIDTSNTINGQPLHYIVNRKGLRIDPSTVENIGYLALINCTNMTVQDIDFSENGQGVLLAFTNDTIIRRIKAAKNNYGIQLISSANDTMTNNTLISNNEDGIKLDYSTKNTIAQNTIANNSNGIRLAHPSNDNYLAYNLITNNTKGLWAYSHSDQNTILHNILANNTEGISMARECSNNTIAQNTITNNSEGISFSFSSNNRIFNNNFVNNTVHAVNSNSINAWDDGYPMGGNYWSNYTGVDANHDGIGDTTSIVDANNTDEYPLAGMFYDFDVTIEQGELCHVQVVSSSTVNDLAVLWWLSSSNQHLQTGQKYVRFSVSGGNDTRGFCRVLIPRNVLNGTYIVLVDWQETPATELAASNTTHAYLYFTYEHSTHEVVVIPELPSGIIMLLLIITSISAVATCRRKPFWLRTAKIALHRARFD